MAGLFDKVSDVINNTAYEISDKAKEITEVSAMNGQIRSQEKSIERMYLEIGQSYYENHKDAESVDYIGLKVTVEKQKEDIKTIKNKD